MVNTKEGKKVVKTADEVEKLDETIEASEEAPVESIPYDNWEEAKKFFIQTLKATERGGAMGINKLLVFLEKSGFYDAPATSKFNGAEPHGLLMHSVTVLHRLIDIMPLLGFELNDNDELKKSMAIVALLHGVGANMRYRYEVHTRRLNGEYVDLGEYIRLEPEECLGYGSEADEAIYIITGFIKLSREEAYAIRHINGDERLSPSVWKRCPLALALHLADEMAIYGDKL